MDSTDRPSRTFKSQLANTFWEHPSLVLLLRNITTGVPLTKGFVTRFGTEEKARAFLEETFLQPLIEAGFIASCPDSASGFRVNRFEIPEELAHPELPASEYAEFSARFARVVADDLADKPAELQRRETFYNSNWIGYLPASRLSEFRTLLERAYRVLAESRTLPEPGDVPFKFVGVLHAENETELPPRAEDADPERRTRRLLQMLAHDVRTPLSQSRLGLKMLEGVRSPEEVTQVLSLLLPTVERAFESVNSLIEDVLDMDRDVEIRLADIRIEDLVVEILAEALTQKHLGKVRIAGRWKHGMRIPADVRKVRRMLQNIVGNALEAMKGSGTLFFSTRECIANGKNVLVLTMGNDGPAIPPGVLPRIFDEFFTSGKARGTGLGLAIARRVMAAHGGTLECVSPSEEAAVEFRATFPSSHGSPYQPQPLPDCASIVSLRARGNVFGPG